jgi:sugar fermentation stimulation protein A
MRFSPPLLPATLIRRYQRFLADVRLPDGTVLTVHCPNSGSMRTCLGPDWPVLLHDSGSTTRRYRYTLTLIHNGRCWIGVDTQLPNRLAADAVAAGRIPGLTGFTSVRREVPWGAHSRLDLLASGPAGDCYIEVKNVTLLGEDGAYAFPDAVTERGRKHLGELMAIRAQGHRAAMLFLIQRSDGIHFRPAAEIDPAYAEALCAAHAAGVELYPCLTRITRAGITLTGHLAPCRLA